MVKPAKGNKRSKGESPDDALIIALTKVASRLNYKYEELLNKPFEWFMVVYKTVNKIEIEEIKTQAMLHGAKREDLDKEETELAETSPLVLDSMGLGKPKGRHYKKRGKI